MWGLGVSDPVIFPLLPSLLPCSLPPVSSLSLTGDTLKWIPEIAPLLFPLSLDADGFFIIFRRTGSYKRVKIHVFKSVYLPSLFKLICDVSLSYSTPIHIPYLCPYLSCGTFQSHPSFSIIDFFHSLNVRPSIRLSPCQSHISLYCLVFLFYICHPTSPPCLYQSSRGLPVYLGINLPLTQPLLNNFFVPFFFYHCNPFNLQPQQLIKHSNKTSVRPLFSTPCPSSVSVKWWMSGKLGCQLWCSDTTATAFFPPISLHQCVSAWSSITEHKYKWNMTLN